MSVEIKIPITGVTLNTKKKYIEDDITVTPNVVKYNGEASEDVTPNEDGLVTRTLTHYYNDRVTSIGDRAFRDYSTLEEIDCPNVTTIGQVAFNECKGLKKINFPKATSIGSQAFVNCIALEKMVFQSATIGQQCIRSCSSLKYVYLKDFKGFTGNGQFADCTGLVALVIDANNIINLTDTSTFVRSSIANGTGFIYFNDELVENYKSATNWSTYASQIKPISELPQEVKDELGIE